LQLKTNTGTFLSPHEAILQNLDWWQHKGNTHHFYPKEVFEKNLSTFNNLPIIFSNVDHPEKGLRGQDIEAVLKKLDGKTVGYTRNSIINNIGSPKLVSTFDITDPDIEKLIQAGDIYLSTGFWYDGADVGRLENVEGDHVLLFQRSKGGTRGDPGAMILNANFDNSFDTHFEDSTMTGEKTDPDQGEGSAITQAYEKLLKTNQDEIVSQKVTIEKQAGDIEDLKKLMLNKDERISALENELEGLKTDKKKADQTIMLNACFLPGTVDYFQDRINDGELDEPVKAMSLMAEMGTYNAGIKQPGTVPAQGNSFKANRGSKQQELDESEAEALSIMAEMKSVTGK
jgi:hypothetical protein